MSDDAQIKIKVVLPGLAPSLLQNYAEWSDLAPQFERRPYGRDGTRLYGVLSLANANALLWLISQAERRVRTSGRPDAAHRANIMLRAKLRLEADIRVVDVE